MVNTIGSMLRAAVQPLKADLDTPAPPHEPVRIHYLLSGCVLLARMTEAMWNECNQWMESGAERFALEAELKDWADTLRIVLDISAKARDILEPLASDAEVTRLYADREKVQAISDEVGELIRWMATPLPPIDLAKIRADGPFKSSEAVIAGL